MQDKTISDKKRNWALLRLSQLTKIKDNLRLGDVFVVEDNLMGSKVRKPRLAVVAKVVDNDKVKVIPVKKDNKLMSLSKFDGTRALHITNVREISKGYLFEKRGFRIAKNATLTSNEKLRLLKKVDKYL